MYCPKCGTQNDDNAFKCVQCGEVLQHIQQADAPVGSVPNYLAHSILATLFCCMPFGIVSIVYAAQVNGNLTVALGLNPFMVLSLPFLGYRLISRGVLAVRSRPLVNVVVPSSWIWLLLLSILLFWILRNITLHPFVLLAP